MKDEWKRIFFKKFLYFGVPGIVMGIVVIGTGVPLAIPFFIPIFAILIAIPLVELLVHYFPDLFYARQWRSRPKPTFSIIRSMKKQKQYDEALEELRRMSNTDSQEVDIWLEMLEIALIDLKDKTMGQKIYREAYSVLESEEKRRLVHRFYSNIV